VNPLRLLGALLVLGLVAVILVEVALLVVLVDSLLQQANLLPPRRHP
jgi:hypothetical protein